MTRRLVTVGELLDGHVGLQVESLDRIYLSVYVPQLQTSGAVAWYLTRFLGSSFPSPAVFRGMGDGFRAAVRSYAESRDIPWVDLDARELRGRVHRDVMAPYQAGLAATGRTGVAAIGRAQEFQLVWVARKRTRADGAETFDFAKATRPVTCFYFYVWDGEFGPGFVKVCTYFPYPIKIWVNGHEWAKRQARRAGIGFTELSNGFATCDDPAALQAICDRLGPADVQRFIDRWLARLPLPLGAAERQAGIWWEASMRQVEIARTLVFDQPRHARGLLESVIADNLDVGRHDKIEIIFGRRVRRDTKGVFRTLLTRPALGPEVAGVVLNVFYKHSRVKQYLKDRRALRIETVVNDPRDLKVKRRLAHLPDLVAAARDINHRILDAERVGQGTVLASPAIERIAHPTVDAAGRRSPALRFGDPRVMALAGALLHLTLAVTGITNKSLRALMTGLTGVAYRSGQATYDLRRLRLAGLIHRIPHTNTYTLTSDGQRWALTYTKINQRLLRPLMAANQPPAPADLREALRTIDRHIDTYITHARLKPAA